MLQMCCKYIVVKGREICVKCDFLYWISSGDIVTKLFVVKLKKQLKCNHFMYMTGS
jgi:hypothetical protein